jgi:hypothetical protein
VVEQSFDWGAVVDQIGDPTVSDKAQYILNDCGNQDSLPVLAASAGWRYGNAGTDGFGGAYVNDRYHYGGHGLFFNPDFIKQYWKPFIESGTVVPGSARQGEGVSAFVRAVARIPLRLIQPLVALLLIGFVAWLLWFFWWSKPAPTDVSFATFIEDFNQVRGEPKSLAAFKKEYVGKRVRWDAYVFTVKPGEEPYYRLGPTPDAPRHEQATAGFAEESFNSALPVGAAITFGGTIDEETNPLGIILRDCDLLNRRK